jgi:hypothetical protein
MNKLTLEINFKWSKFARCLVVEGLANFKNIREKGTLQKTGYS